jgi:DtxR family transcriptional regulator, manganese transport regulator
MAGQHTRVRKDHATELAEDYVEAIAEVIAKQGACRAVDLVKKFEVRPVTINRALGRLQRDGLVDTEPYGPVLLTTKGKKLATMASQRHAIVYQFLLSLGIDPATAKTDSEGIEHHVSPVTLKAMQKFITAEQQA